MLRKIGTKIICLCMIFQLFYIVPISAASTTEVIAYKNYFNKYLDSKTQYPYGGYTLHDINKDGTKEMFFEYMSGVRSGFKIYTYKNNKVKCIKSVTGVSCIMYKGNQILILTSGGAADNTYTVYTFDGNSLIKKSEYKSVSKYNSFNGNFTVKFYCNGRKISRENFVKKRDSLNKWKKIIIYNSF